MKSRQELKQELKAELMEKYFWWLTHQVIFSYHPYTTKTLFLRKAVSMGNEAVLYQLRIKIISLDASMGQSDLRNSS